MDTILILTLINLVWLVLMIVGVIVWVKVFLKKDLKQAIKDGFKPHCCMSNKKCREGWAKVIKEAIQEVKK